LRVHSVFRVALLDAEEREVLRQSPLVTAGVAVLRNAGKADGE
jgi:hypothetical protein